VLSFFVWNSYAVNSVNSVTNTTNPTISFVFAITSMAVAGEIPYVGLTVVVGGLSIMLQVANESFDGVAMVPSYHGAPGNVMLTTPWETLYLGFTGVWAFVIATLVTASAGIVLGREHAKSRAVAEMSKAIARLTRRYDTDTMKETLDAYEAQGDLCDVELLQYQRDVLANLEKYRPHLPTYLLHGTDSSADGHDSDLDANLESPPLESNTPSVHGSMYSEGHSSAGSSEVVTLGRSAVSGSLGQQRVASSVASSGKVARRSRGVASTPAELEVYRGTISIARVSLCHIADVVAGKALAGDERALCRHFNDVVLAVYAAADATNGYVLAACGDEVVVSWNATRRAMRPAVKACDFGARMGASLGTNHHGGSPTVSLAGSHHGSTVGYRAQPTELPFHISTSIISGVSNCFFCGDARRRTFATASFADWHQRSLEVAREAAAFGCHARSSGAASAWTFVDAATRGAAEFTHDLAPVAVTRRGTVHDAMARDAATTTRAAFDSTVIYQLLGRKEREARADEWMYQLKELEEVAGDASAQGPKATADTATAAHEAALLGSAHHLARGDVEAAAAALPACVNAAQLPLRLRHLDEQIRGLLDRDHAKNLCFESRPRTTPFC
jgi:hypothetical protein